MEHKENIPASPVDTGGELATSLPISPEPGDSPSRLDFEPVQLAWRSDGWTPERQRAFIEELADCGVVREAAARVGMTERSARNLRLRPDAAAFNLAWEAAVRAGTEQLHSIAYERAVNGTVRPRYYRGQLVGEERVFDNRLLIYLLGRADKAAGNRNVGNRLDNWEAWLSAVEDGLAEPMPEPDELFGSRVWRDEDGLWLTNFPPPEDFDGEQWGCHGEEEYCRELSAREREAIRAWEGRSDAEDARLRDLYFHRLTEVPHPR